MRNIIKLSFSILITVFVISCLSQQGDDFKEISKIEKKMQGQRQDPVLAAKLDGAYKTFIQKYPADTNVPRMLFEDAQLNIYPLNKKDDALDQLSALYTKYPQNRYAPNALFKSAYLNEKAQRFDKAKDQYLLFVKTYPTNELASQAKILASMTGLSEEEQFKQIMSKQGANRDSTKDPKKGQ